MSVATLQHAIDLFRQGRRDEAVAGARLLAERGERGAADLVGMFVGQLGNLREAVSWFERAIAADPRHAGAHEHLGDAYFSLGDRVRAIEPWLAAQRLEPNNPGIYPKLIMVLGNAGRHAEVARQTHEAFARCRDCTQVIAAAIPSLKDSGRAGEAVTFLREAQRRTGARWELQEMLQLPVVYFHGATGREVCDEARALGRLLSAAFPEDTRPFANAPEEGRPLRIGYLSQDFRNSAAGHFVEALFTHHDPRACSAHAYYSDVMGHDELTARLKARATSWLDIKTIPDAGLVDRLRADGIDILVDLIGLGPLNRLAVLARRVAPIQAHYMGYLGTTGLPTMDYRIVDPITDPPGSDDLATERLVRLDRCFMCYTPPHHAPPISHRTGEGPVVFGSFNTMIKIGPPVAALWARVLRAVPGSQLVIKNPTLGNADVAARCRDLFAAEGVVGPALELRGPTAARGDHMAMYADIDIALDPFPYNGSTTTLEALWMGVPVVNLVGDRHCARAGRSLLTHAGLAEFSADTPDDYVRIAAGLAADAGRRRTLRSSLRESVRANLCDAAPFTRAMEAVYREMWRTWCRSRRA